MKNNKKTTQKNTSNKQKNDVYFLKNKIKYLRNIPSDYSIFFILLKVMKTI